MKYPQKPGFKARQTAKAAAVAMTKKALPLRERIYATLKAAGRPGLTSDEVAERLGISILSVRPRFSELSIMGAIEDTMKRRANAVSGRHAIVWRAK